MKYAIIAMIWSGFGDFASANYLKKMLKHETDVFFIYKMDTVINNNIIAVIESMFDNFKFVSLNKIKEILGKYDYIIQSTASYNFDEIYNILRYYYPKKLKNYKRIFDWGMSYEINYKPEDNFLVCNKIRRGLTDKKSQEYNIYTGFSKYSSGIQIGLPKPKKDFVLQFKKYVLYTCYYLTDVYVDKYVDFVNDIAILTSKKNILVFIQKLNYDIITKYQFVGTIGKYKIYKYKNIYLTVGIVTFNESNELFAYSEFFVGCRGNLSTASVINYKKFPIMEWEKNMAQSHCLLRDFLKNHKMEALYQLFFSLSLDTETNTDNFLNDFKINKNKFNSFIRLIHTKYNLGENLNKMIGITD